MGLPQFKAEMVKYAPYKLAKARRNSIKPLLTNVSTEPLELFHVQGDR